MLNFGSTLSERRYLRIVFLDSPVRRDISRIEKRSRLCQRLMTLNNSMSITLKPPAKAKGARFEHGSVLGGKTRSPQAGPWGIEELIRLTGLERRRLMKSRAH